MSLSTHSPLHHQVQRVRRLMFLQIFINSLVWCMTGALAVAVLCILLQPIVLPAVPGQSFTWPRVGLAAGLAGAGVLLALAWAWLRTPSRTTAALLLDEKFGLRERVTTSLTLTAEQQATPMGQALLADVEQRVTQLSVPSRMGVRLPWTAVLVPVSASVVALVAALWPNTMQADSGKPAPFTVAPVVAARIDKQMDAIKEENKQDEDERKQRTAEGAEEAPFEEFDELQQILSGPRDTEEELRERMKELTELDDRLSKKLRNMDEKEKTQQEQFDRLSKKKKQEGPAKELQDALSRGDLDKARQEAERLARELESGELSAEDRAQLKEQVEELEKELEQLSRKEIEEEEQKLKDQAEEGEIDEETLDREMDQLKQKKEDLKEMEELAKELGECDKSMGEGNDAEAAARMKRVARKLKKMGAGKQDRDNLAKLSKRTQQAKNGMGGGMGRGRRPEAKEGETKSFDTKAKSPVDPKGQRRVVGHGPAGKNYKAKSVEELSKEIKQAAQDAPEALARQRIPRAASDIAKGYFENIGGQKEAEKKNKP